MKSVFFFSKTGCLLPLFILGNFFFGWMFLKTSVWLLVEGVLILLFILNSYILTKRISSFSAKRDNAIDVEAEVVEERSF